MIGHSTLFRIHASLHLRTLQPSQPRPFDLSRLKRREAIDTAEASFTRLKLEDDVFYQWTTPKLPGIDSFVVMEDRSTVVMFQFTLHMKRSVNIQLIQRIRQKIGDGVEMVLVFVVPSDLADVYKEQVWSGNLGSLTRDVAQYVCGLAAEDLEETIRTGF